MRDLFLWLYPGLNNMTQGYDIRDSWFLLSTWVCGNAAFLDQITSLIDFRMNTDDLFRTAETVAALER